MKFLAGKIHVNTNSRGRLIHYSLFNLLLAGTALADIQTGTLGSQPGATDVYQLNCSSLENADTSHASLQLLDATPESQAPQPPQLINVELSKEGVAPVSNSITEGNTSQFILAGGNGKYQLKIDTNNSNPSYPKQNYQVSFQCYNENNVVTAGSGSGLKAGKTVNKTIATYNNKKKKIPATKVYKINCKTNRKATPIDSSYLKVTINNTTVHFDASEIYLNAQLTRLDTGSTINASDRPGDAEPGSAVQLAPFNKSGNAVGNGNYYISVNTSADNQTIGKLKDYSFEYGCHSAQGSPTTANISRIQDQ